jgi:hypothetical protein
MVANGTGPQKAAWATILLLIGVFSVGRFVGLEKSPPGLYADEAVVTTEAIALLQTGFNSHHEHTLFTPMEAGGYASPTHLYPKAAWIALAGYSIPALRLYAGVEATLLLAGLFFLARSRLGPRAAVFVLLAGCLSPWIFQFSRIATDDPMLSLCGLVWGMYFFFRSTALADAIIAAVCFSVSVYGYASARVTLPFLVPLLLWVKQPDRKATFRYLAAFVVTGLVVCAPLILGALRGTLLSRYAVIGIFAPAHLQGTSFPAALGEFLYNVRLHLAPDYLFVSGDANLRHSTQFTGEFSWLDTFALLLGVALLGLATVRSGRLPVNRFIVLCAAGFVVGIFPSALTWEGVPHAIRGSECWVFVALLTGFILSQAEQRWRWALPAGALVSVTFAVGFLWHYFRVYPREARDEFQVTRLEAAEHGRATGDWQPLARLTRHDPPLAIRYYLIAYAGLTFDESSHLFAQLPPTLPRALPPNPDPVLGHHLN